MIVVSSLGKSYGDNTILSNINLSFEKGKINGLVGENGAGKTTFFRCITGLEPHIGTVKYSDGILKNVTGFLPTNPYFLSKITGMEYLQLLCNARNIDVSDFNDKNVFDLPLKQYASTYSTGMKKKLALTAILLQKNEIFIFDEPFNGVDIQSNIVIKEVLMKLKELNKIIVLSSHIFETLNETCDYLHHLRGGEIIRSVKREEFHLIKDEMTGSGIGDKLSKLNLE